MRAGFERVLKPHGEGPCAEGPGEAAAGPPSRALRPASLGREGPG